MAKITLVLGPIFFADFEVPSGINFGGEQRLAVHRLPGGVRVVDALGRDDATITFAGIFTGSEATLRARALDELRALGTPLPLTWDVFFYSVVIQCFEADYQTSNWIPYRISCTVIRDEASVVLDAAASLAVSALADISSAVSSAALAGVDISDTQGAITAAGATTAGTAASSTAQISLTSAQASLNEGLTSSESSLSSAAVANAASPSSGVLGLSQATESAGQLSQLSQARAYLGRAALNLSNAST